MAMNTTENRSATPAGCLIGILLAGALALSGCSAESGEDGQEIEALSVEHGGARVEAFADGEIHEIAGVGRIRYLAGVRNVATIAFSGGGALHFQESELGHGCAGFFPADAGGEPALTAAGDGCLSAFIAFTSSDTPIPAVLLREFDGDHEIGEREVVDALESPVDATHLPLLADVHPQASGDNGTDNSHSCATGTGDPGTSAHWVDVHCDEGGADHCDPGWLTDQITISSGATYKGSYQTGLFCNTGDDVVNFHYYYSGGWNPIWGWNSVGINDNAYLHFSRWLSLTAWQRRITTNAGSGQYRHYTKMCASGVGEDCPASG